MTSWKRWTIVAAGLLAAVAVATLAQSSGLTEVFVANLPKIFEVQGEVAVKGTVDHAVSVEREGVVVTTSHRGEWTELVPAGTVDTSGFTSVTLSLQGEVKAANTADGTVGVLLLPDQEPVLRALKDAKRVEFPIESACALAKGGSAYFDAGSITQTVAFPRYRIFLYNTAPHAVEANVYLYLRN